MPKISTKFTAEFAIKVGKTPVAVKIPLDLTATPQGQSFEDYVKVVLDAASSQLSSMVENANFKFKNQSALKRAFKAYAKANPPAEQSA